MEIDKVTLSFIDRIASKNIKGYTESALKSSAKLRLDFIFLEILNHFRNFSPGTGKRTPNTLLGIAVLTGNWDMNYTNDTNDENYTDDTYATEDTDEANDTDDIDSTDHTT